MFWREWRRDPAVDPSLIPPGHVPISSLSSLRQVPSLRQAHQWTLNSRHVNTDTSTPPPPLEQISHWKHIYCSIITTFCGTNLLHRLTAAPRNKSNVATVCKKQLRTLQSWGFRAPPGAVIVQRQEKTKTLSWQDDGWFHSLNRLKTLRYVSEWITLP